MHRRYRLWDNRFCIIRSQTPEDQGIFKHSHYICIRFYLAEWLKLNATVEKKLWMQIMSVCIKTTYICWICTCIFTLCVICLQAVHRFAQCEWFLLMRMTTLLGSELWSIVWALKQMLPKVLWSHRSKPLTLTLGLMGGSPTPFTARHAYHWLMFWRSGHLTLYTSDYCSL